MDEPVRVDARTERLGAVLGAAAAVTAFGLGWGFTVDDAWISARVAWNLAGGRGHAFDPGGPAVDAVTPLGWACLLTPFAAAGPARAVLAARVAGVVTAGAAAAWLGREIASLGGSRWRFSPLLVLAVSLPFGAWCGAGMETGVVTALATRALGRDRWALAAGGLAAAWRPELAPWALVLAAASTTRLGAPGVAPGLRALTVLAPVGAAALVRLVAFGSPLPLAVIAKPSDLGHGATYALAASVHGALPALLVAPRAWGRVSAGARGPALAAAAHLGAVTLAGGDWMSLFRLVVPVLPSLTLVAALLAAAAAPWATLARTGVALALAIRVVLDVGPAARGVMRQREALIARVGPGLGGARHVIALDVGWVGAAHSGQVVDLAGVTDPEVARFAGGHTSKRWPAGAIAQRRPDAAILLMSAGAAPATPWWRTSFAREVERRVAEELRDRSVLSVQVAPLDGTSQGYLVLRFEPEPR